MRTMRSTKGMIHLSPALFTPSKRPSRNTTPRSYSVITRAPIAKSTTAMPPKSRRLENPNIVSLPVVAKRSAVRRGPAHAQRHALDRGHLDVGPGRERLVRARRPVLAAHEDPPVRRERRHAAAD